MSNATRYLCAAAYLDPSFTNGVIRELVASHPGGDPGRARIDPVELHSALRKRLLELNDPDLPPNERIGALTPHSETSSALPCTYSRRCC